MSPESPKDTAQPSPATLKGHGSHTGASRAGHCSLLSARTWPCRHCFKNVLKLFTNACVAMSPHIPSPLPFLLSLLSHQEWIWGEDWQMRGGGNPGSCHVLLLCHSNHSGGASSAEGMAVRLQGRILTESSQGAGGSRGNPVPGNLGACHHGNASILGQPE